MECASAQDVLNEFRRELASVRDAAQLGALRRAYLGKEGRLRLLSQSLRELPPDRRKPAAAAFNETKSAVERELDDAEALLEARLAREKLEREWMDPTMPGVAPARGARHVVTLVERRCLAVLRQLGFQLIRGPEVESPFYNFDALNIPDTHPARDMQDTFWVEGGLVLRSHTTPIQARTLEARPPLPIKVASAGRVYRNEAVDATHLAMFHQLEGFWVDRGITFAHLKGVIEFVARALYGADRPFRLKPKYYPYTEPSVGMDIQCAGCAGSGCDACHGAGWITIIGAGMIHRNVFSRFEYDPNEVSGMAFGWGVTRMAAQWIGLPRVKSLYEQDLRLMTSIQRNER